MGDGDRTPEADGGNSSPWLGFVPGALNALPLLPAGTEVPGSCPGAGGEHGPVYPTAPLTKSLKWSFERQALEIKGSDDRYEIHPCLLSDSLLRQRPSSVSHLPVCVTVVVAALNINVKGY